MNIPKLRKEPTVKSCHNIDWEDDYSWVHQENILEVLKDGSKLLPEIKKYLEEENEYTKKQLSDTEPMQKKLFDEIKARIKLDDESLPYKDKNYEYWTKVTKEGNYSKKLRRKIDGTKIETYWDGDVEAKGKKFFSTGDVVVSHNDEFLAYSIDDKGSEYFTIFIRRLSDNKIIEEPITDTAGGQIMGDWAQGEFQVAGEVAGVDYSCLPGMGFNEILDTGGDAFYFPVIDDADTKAAQMELASLLISPEVQVEFNLAKGSLPVRGDIDMSSANACMQKGLNILAAGGVMPSNRQTFDADTDQQINDLMAEFWATDMSAEDAQASYVSIIKRAN